MRTLDDIAVQSACWAGKPRWAPITASDWLRSPNRRLRREAKLKALNERWEKEKDLVDKIRELRGQIEAASGPVQAVREQPLSRCCAPGSRDHGSLRLRMPAPPAPPDTAALRASLPSWCRSSRPAGRESADRRHGGCPDRRAK